MYQLGTANKKYYVLKIIPPNYSLRSEENTEKICESNRAERNIAIKQRAENKDSDELCHRSKYRRSASIYSDFSENKYFHIFLGALASCKMMATHTIAAELCV